MATKIVKALSPNQEENEQIRTRWKVDLKARRIRSVNEKEYIINKY